MIKSTITRKSKNNNEVNEIKKNGLEGGLRSTGDDIDEISHLAKFDRKAMRSKTLKACETAPTCQTLETHENLLG